VTPIGWRDRFDALTAKRMRASSRPLTSVRTVEDRARAFAIDAVADDWSSAIFDGPFYQSQARDGSSMGVVFVRSREGNTGTDDPSSLGGGAIDEQVIYEGLSRVAADAVVVGAATLHEESFFTVWRPELVSLRQSLGLPRHPAQVVLSIDGRFDPDAVLLFNLPDVPVFVVTSDRGERRLSLALASRPWVTAITGTSLRDQFNRLRDRGLRRLCSVGGRRSATALVDAGLVQDVYLTTTSVSGGEPETPWYVGQRELTMGRVVVKEWEGASGVVRFEHCLLAGS
jgi:riboflavin biosynthesis pyrimidine reductase